MVSYFLGLSWHVTEHSLSHVRIMESRIYSCEVSRQTVDNASDCDLYKGGKNTDLKARWSLG
jgi:hypothetical protein